MTTLDKFSKATTFTLGDRPVNRLGYGAMQLAGPGVFGPPKDRGAALAVLREAVASGVNHIDTADTYGPHVTNQLIREALAPYPDDLVIATKVGAVRDAQGGWPPARAPEQLRAQVHDNLRNLGVDVLEVVNLRVGGLLGPEPGSIAEPFAALVQMQQEGLIRHLGVSNVNAEQVAEAQATAQIVEVQNLYNVAHREDDDLSDALAAQSVANVPYLPRGGFSPIQSSVLSEVAARRGATPVQVALAWLLRRSPNILLIPGTSSVEHFRDNLKAAELLLPEEALAELDGIGQPASPSA